MLELFSNNTKHININPIGKPRMTRADRWKKRPCILRYWAFKNKLVAWASEVGLTIPPILIATFVMPMPSSWSRKKKELMYGMPHQQKSDIDNISKSLMDSLCKDDSYVHTLFVKKVWGYHGRIIFFGDKQ